MLPETLPVLSKTKMRILECVLVWLALRLLGLVWNPQERVNLIETSTYCHVVGFKLVMRVVVNGHGQHSFGFKEGQIA